MFSDSSQIRTLDGIHLKSLFIGELVALQFGDLLRISVKTLSCYTQTACVSQISIRIGDSSVGYVDFNVLGQKQGILVYENGVEKYYTEVQHFRGFFIEKNTDKILFNIRSGIEVIIRKIGNYLSTIISVESNLIPLTSCSGVLAGQGLSIPNQVYTTFTLSPQADFVNCNSSFSIQSSIPSLSSYVLSFSSLQSVAYLTHPLGDITALDHFSKSTIPSHCGYITNSDYTGESGHAVHFNYNSVYTRPITFTSQFTIELMVQFTTNDSFTLWSLPNSHDLQSISGSLVLSDAQFSWPTGLTLRSMSSATTWCKVLLTRSTLDTDVYIVGTGGAVKRYTSPSHLPQVNGEVRLYLGQAYIAGKRIFDWPVAGRSTIDNLVVWRRSLESTVVRDLWLMPFSVAAEFGEFSSDFDVPFSSNTNMKPQFDIDSNTTILPLIYYPEPWWPTVDSIASAAPMDSKPSGFNLNLKCANRTEARWICTRIYEHCYVTGSNVSRVTLIAQCELDVCRTTFDYGSLLYHFEMFSNCNVTYLVDVMCQHSTRLCNQTTDVDGLFKEFVISHITKKVSHTSNCSSIEYDGHVTDLNLNRKALSKSGTYSLFESSNITCSVDIDYINFDLRVIGLTIVSQQTSITFNSNWNLGNSIAFRIDGTLHNITSYSSYVNDDTIILRNESHTISVVSSNMSISIHFIDSYLEVYICDYKQINGGLMHNVNSSISKYLSSQPIYDMYNQVIELQQSLFFIDDIRIYKKFTVDTIFETDLYGITLFSFSESYVISINTNGFIELSCFGVTRKTSISIVVNHWTQVIVTMGEYDTNVYAFVNDRIIRETVNMTCAIDVIGFTFGGRWRGLSVKTKSFSGRLALLSYWSEELSYSQVLQLKWKSIDVDQMPGPQMYLDSRNIRQVLDIGSLWPLGELQLVETVNLSPLINKKIVHQDDFHDEYCDFSDLSTVCNSMDILHYSDLCKATTRIRIPELINSMLLRCRYISSTGVMCGSNETITNYIVAGILREFCSPCVYGTSMNNSTCECNRGFWGDTCLEQYPYTSNGICSDNGIGNPNTGVCICNIGYTGRACEIVLCENGFSGSECQFSDISFDTSARDNVIGQIDQLSNVILFNSESISDTLDSGSYEVVSIAASDFSCILHVENVMTISRVYAITIRSSSHVARVELTGNENMYRIVTTDQIFENIQLMKIEGVTYNPRYLDLLIITSHNTAIEIILRILPNGIISTISLSSTTFATGLLKDCSSSDKFVSSCFNKYKSSNNAQLNVPATMNLPMYTCLKFSNSSMISDQLIFNIDSKGLTIEIYITKIHSENGILYKFNGMVVSLDKLEVIINDGLQIHKTGLFITTKISLRLNFHWNLNGMFTVIMYTNEMTISSLIVRSLSPTFISEISIGDEHIDCEISSIRFWNRPLSSLLVNAYGNSAITYSSPNLLYAWTIHEAFGNEIFSLDYKIRFKISIPKWIACDKDFRIIGGITRRNNNRTIQYKTIMNDICNNGLDISHRKKCIVHTNQYLRDYFYLKCINGEGFVAFDEYCYTLRYSYPQSCQLNNDCCKYGHYDWNTLECKCDDGNWGKKCDKKCPIECKNKECPDGKCLCSDQWSDSCTLCANGWIGLDCSIHVDYGLKDRITMVQGNFILTLDGISYDSSSLIGHFRMLENEVLEVQMVFGICFNVPNCRNLEEIIVVDKINHNIYNIDSSMQITRKGKTKSSVVDSNIVENGININIDSTGIISVIFDNYVTIYIANSKNRYLYVLMDDLGSGEFTGALGNGNFEWKDDVNFGIYDNGIFKSISHEDLLSKYLTLKYLTDNIYRLYHLNSTTSYSRYPHHSSKRLHSNAGHMLDLKASPLVIDGLKSKLIPLIMFEFSFNINLHRGSNKNIDLLTMAFSEHSKLYLQINSDEWIMRWHTCYLNNVHVSYDVWLSITIKWYSRSGNCSLQINQQTTVSYNKTYIGEIVTIDSIEFGSGSPDSYSLDHIQLLDIDDKPRLTAQFDEGTGNSTRIIVTDSSGKPDYISINLDDQQWKQSTLEIDHVDNARTCNTSSNCSSNDPALESMKVIMSKQCSTELFEYVCSTKETGNTCNVEEPISKVILNNYILNILFNVT